MDDVRALWRVLDAPGRAALLDELETVWGVWPVFRQWVDLDSDTLPAMNRDPWGAAPNRTTIGISQGNPIKSRWPVLLIGLAAVAAYLTLRG